MRARRFPCAGLAWLLFAGVLPAVQADAPALKRNELADGPADRRQGTRPARAADARLAEVATPGSSAAKRPAIRLLVPPEQGFFAKRLDYQGIPIKGAAEVADGALYAAYDRLSLQLGHLPMVVSNLVAAGAELHIIGRDQVTTDLPEWRMDKGKPLAEYHGLTRDQRTRGMGGLLTSCGEENLLQLEKDRYRGRDICIHEFAHSVRHFGISRAVRERFDAQYRASLAKGRWRGAYAGSNPDEFFAELSMWYFGTHGDLAMSGVKPDDGAEGLRRYDPEAFALLDEFYRGRIAIDRVEPHRP